MRTLPTIFHLKPQNNNMSINPLASCMLCCLYVTLFPDVLQKERSHGSHLRFPSPLICNYWLPLPEPRVPLNRHSSIRACVTKSLMIRLRSDGQSITWTHSCKYNKMLWIATGTVDVDVLIISTERIETRNNATHFVFGWMWHCVYCDNCQGLWPMFPMSWPHQ